MYNLDDQNLELGYEIRSVVERQLQQPDLEAVNEALKRLREQDISRENAIETIGAVLLEEMEEIMTEQEAFDRGRYVERLQDL